MATPAVILDVGSVVLESPLSDITAYEVGTRLPRGSIAKLVTDGGPHGPWP